MQTSVMRAEKDNSLASNGNSNNNVCSGCTLPIIDPCLSKVLDKLWHDRCLRCAECQVVLREKCFARDSNLYCKQDFYKIYGVQCGGCNGGLVPQDLVRRIGNRFFHMTCLKCFRCHKEIATGDQLYILEDGAFLCKSDYDNQMAKNKLKLSLNTSSKIETDSDGEEEQSSLVPFPVVGGVVAEHAGSDEDDEPNRRRGPRTTIKAKQLDVLKAAFLATPKPSKHVREQLAKDTGLTMRVIQVWFQNRRSKERRVKQLPPQEPARCGRKAGVSEEGNDNSYQMFSNPVYPQQPAPPQPQQPTAPAPPAASIQTIEGWFGQQQGYGFFSSGLNSNSSGSKSDTTGTHNNSYASNTSINVNNSLRNTNTPTSTNSSTDSNHNECKITTGNNNINIDATSTANVSGNNYSTTGEVPRKTGSQDKSINNLSNQNDVNKANSKINNNGNLCKRNGNSHMNIDESKKYNSIKYTSSGNNSTSNKEKVNSWNGSVDKCILTDAEASSRIIKQDNLLAETYTLQGLKVLATGE